MHKIVKGILTRCHRFLIMRLKMGIGEESKFNFFLIMIARELAADRCGSAELYIIIGTAVRSN